MARGCASQTVAHRSTSPRRCASGDDAPACHCAPPPPHWRARCAPRPVGRLRWSTSGRAERGHCPDGLGVRCARRGWQGAAGVAPHPAQSDACALCFRGEIAASFPPLKHATPDQTHPAVSQGTATHPAVSLETATRPPAPMAGAFRAHPGGRLCFVFPGAGACTMRPRLVWPP